MATKVVEKGFAVEDGGILTSLSRKILPQGRERRKDVERKEKGLGLALYRGQNATFWAANPRKDLRIDLGSTQSLTRTPASPIRPTCQPKRVIRLAWLLVDLVPY